MQDLIQQISDKFRERFAAEPLLVMSPGRVNLIGEHPDYSEGFVLPAATDKAVVFALMPRQDTICHFISHDYGQEFRCDLHELGRSPLRWPDYLEGIIDQFVRNGYPVRGFQCVFGGNIPSGAGMSSSAAIEGGLTFALNEMFRLKIDSLSLVKLAQKAENEFVGVRCGIMDQFINIHGREKKILKLDCRSLEFEYFPLERPDLHILVCDTLVRRELASSEYNVRRGQCEAGVAVLKKCAPGIRSLRDVGFCLLEEHRAELDPVVYRRCNYVLRENIRVREACRDLMMGDFKSFGERMRVSHAGLRDGYEVSSPELDALVEAGSVPEFRERVGRDYQVSFGRKSNIHVVRIEAGTHII